MYVWYFLLWLWGLLKDVECGCGERKGRQIDYNSMSYSLNYPWLMFAIQNINILYMPSILQFLHHQVC